MSEIPGTCGAPRTQCGRVSRNLVVTIVVAVLVAFTVRVTVAQSFYAATNGVSPKVPQGARVLAYRLASAYSPGDIIFFQGKERFMLSRVTAVAGDGRLLTVQKNGRPEIKGVIG